MTDRARGPSAGSRDRDSGAGRPPAPGEHGAAAGGPQPGGGRHGRHRSRSGTPAEGTATPTANGADDGAADRRARDTSPSGTARDTRRSGPDASDADRRLGRDRSSDRISGHASGHTSGHAPRRAPWPGSAVAGDAGPAPGHGFGHRPGHSPRHTPEHGHGHGHGPAAPASDRVRTLLAILLVPCALASIVGVVLLWPTDRPAPPRSVAEQEQVLGAVSAATVADCQPGSGERDCVALTIRMADGPRAGRDLVQLVPVEPGTPRYAVGDDVVLAWSGAEPDDAEAYSVVDFQRGHALAWLAGLFALAVLVLGRWRGLSALVALGLSFAVLLLFVLPAILGGQNPLAVAVVGAGLIMFGVLYLTHGLSARTSTAVLGTLVSLVLIGVLAAAFAAFSRLTGLDDETIDLISSLGARIDARGLLLAGVVIGALGVLDDVTVTQTSAVWELRRANPLLGPRALFTAAMRIGRDHVASAVNTLVLAYAGAALPLLLIFSLGSRTLGQALNSQIIATEIVRTLVGSIGLVASVPITTALAAWVASREPVPREVPA